MITSVVLTFFLTALWQGAMIATVCWFAIKFVCIENASTRTTLWSLAFGIAAILPFSIFLPASDVPALQSLPIAQPVAINDVAAASIATTLTATKGQPVLSFAAIAAPTILFLWIAGAALRLIGLCRDAVKISKMRVESALIKEDRSIQTPQGIELRLHPSIASPVATGLFRPMILMPMRFARIPETPAHRSILAHEIAHIRRGDLFANLFETFVLAIFWWNPSLYFMRTEIADSREMACDDEAVLKTKSARGYAQVLVDSAERTLNFRDGHRAVLALTGRPSGFSKRIERLAAGDYSPRNKTKPLRLIVTVAAISAATSFSTIAAPRVAFAGPSDSDSRVEKTDADTKAQTLGRAMVHAVLDNDMTQAQHLLERGADLNAVLELDGTPLIAAVNDGSFEFANWLITNGANVDAYAIYDETALISAVRSNSIAMVRLLIAAGANVNLSAKTENGVLRSPLSEARRNNYRDIEMELIAAGAVQ